MIFCEPEQHNHRQTENHCDAQVHVGYNIAFYVIKQRVASCPECLDREWLLSSFAKHQSVAIDKFKSFVAERKN